MLYHMTIMLRLRMLEKRCGTMKKFTASSLPLWKRRRLCAEDEVNAIAKHKLVERPPCYYSHMKRVQRQLIREHADCDVNACRCKVLFCFIPTANVSSMQSSICL